MSERKPDAFTTLRLTTTQRKKRGKGLPMIDDGRPLTRGDCVDGMRPCPWVGCRYHLFLDVNELTGSIRLRFGGIDFDEIPETCSLDVAEGGPSSLEQIASLMNFTRERARQIEAFAFRTLSRDRKLGVLHREAIAP